MDSVVAGPCGVTGPKLLGTREEKERRRKGARFFLHPHTAILEENATTVPPSLFCKDGTVCLRRRAQL